MNEISKEKLKLIDGQFDDVMEHIGWCGAFTLRLYAVMFVIIIWGAMNIASAVFLVADVPHQCAIADDLKVYVEETCDFNWTSNQASLTGPVEDDKLSVCLRYTKSSLFNVSCTYWESGNLTGDNLTEETCTKWSYDNSMFTSTLVTDLNLVCEKKWMTKLPQLLLMFGVLLGALLCGIGSDRWGRRTCFSMSLIILTVFALLTSFVKIFWIFLLIRMMVGVGAIGLCVSGVVYATEITSVRHRVLVNQMLQSSFSIAFMFLALFAYLERRWFYLNLILSIPIIAFVPFYMWFSDESPRWLLSKGKSQAALRSLNRMATVNKTNLSEFFDQFKDNEVLGQENLTIQESDKSKATRVPSSTLDIFRNPTLRVMSMILFYNWFAVTCIYYGLTLNTGSLNGNPFLNFFLIALVEIPANLGAVAVIKAWGRRPTICICNVIAGICLLCMMFTPNSEPTINVMLVLIGKFGTTASFSCIYLYTAELYPTPLRGNGVGICSGWARIGGMVSLLIIMLGDISQNLPFIVFGFIAALAGVSILLLPETKGLPLPETTHDTEQMYKHRSITLAKQFVPESLRKSCS
ncbi:unnamed protein product [Clavelina lepadiformis]|uniref:Major facilitator superfamily (MFS) profile domain-containing protein n=1 Tax=Clavelina lepadiformis TaxID=159417 RepID=A0ABP0F1R9_CLALP